MTASDVEFASMGEDAAVTVTSPFIAQPGPVATTVGSSKATAFLGLLVVSAAMVGVFVAIAKDVDRAPPPFSSGPEQVMLSPLGNGVDASHLLSVTWVVPYGASFSGVPPSNSLSPAPEIVNSGVAAQNPHVRWGFRYDFLTFTCAADTATYNYSTSNSSYFSPLLFNATIGPLDPFTTFYYQVGDDANGFSNVYQSMTLPPAGTPNVRLAVIGDLGTTNNSAATLDHILANSGATGDGRPPMSAVLLVGDLSYADQTQGVWDIFGNMVQPVASVLPWLNIIGNHEWFDFVDPATGLDTFTSYISRFRTPAGTSGGGSSLYYSVSTGLIKFIGLQGYCPTMTLTSTQPCLAPGTPQMVWLQAELASVDRATTPWVVVAFHQPYVNSNTKHNIASEGLPMQAAVEDVLYGAGVDLVLSGHVHAYERAARTYNYTCRGDAPVYITIGDGGNREGLATGWVSPQPDWSLMRQASYGHGELTAVNLTHLYWAWHQNPDLAPVIADEIWIQKGVVGQCGGGRTTEPVYASVRKQSLSRQ